MRETLPSRHHKPVCPRRLRPNQLGRLGNHLAMANIAPFLPTAEEREEPAISRGGKSNYATLLVGGGLATRDKLLWTLSTTEMTSYEAAPGAAQEGLLPWGTGVCVHVRTETWWPSLKGAKTRLDTEIWAGAKRAFIETESSWTPKKMVCWEGVRIQPSV